MAQAAIHNGADAIYVGMPGFNARGRTHDHSFEELKDIIELCHLYNVHVHVAFNILIFQEELEEAIKTLKKVLALGPDALIIQDLGIVKIVKELAPNQVVHASTQMTVTNHEAIELLDDLSIDRFVLGRENSLSEIKLIKEKTKKELEVFVHGALCVAYSGQCFTSESLGGRSANRGQCAQSCRFEYDLYVDDKKKELKNLKYLVSPKDLCAIEDVPTLMELGVESFKVEGRLKSTDFVASVARSYREVIDTNTKINKEKLKESRDEMEISFSRGFYNGWIDGVAHQKLVDGAFASNKGLELGSVIRVSKTEILVDSKMELKPGDGIFFLGGKHSFGANVYGVQRKQKNYLLRFQKSIDLSAIEVDSRVFLNNRESLTKELTKTFTAKDELKRIPIDIEVKCIEGKKITLVAKEGKFNINIESEFVCESAKSSGATKESILKTLSGLSHTAYFIDKANIELSENLFINNKALKLLKQDMVTALNKERIKREVTFSNDLILPIAEAHSKSQAKITPLVRTYEQLEGVVEYLKVSHYKEYLDTIILDYEFGKDFVKSVKLLKENNLPSMIATTRVLKPNEYHNFTLIKRADPDGILIRNLGALNYFKDSKYVLHGDFSLNITNSVTFDYLKKKGLSSLCLSYDLNNKRLLDLLDHIDTSMVSITAHQYMPEFHMEHCVFAAFLSEGNSFRDCGKPCEKHKVHLEDMYGNRHEIKADQECRNTMFNAKAMSAVSLIPQWQEKGVGSFRFEALHESPDELISKLKVYFSLISGELSEHEVLSKLGKLENYGVGTGQLLKNKKYIDRKKNV